ncbi:hypothetical protein IMG5_110240 [Ichthyophthirius multifiliis]|uniref:Uncharacterized protein n=1 Tax=Ichthyophthirius multifiliis TaxID=5932 RepID=G0QTN5_ICHMU|nr:hypothetical protein IMG5_110240 [Ichthyophthirius multifiliis]EGR31408.1 hypothetical protein IMG5_110240 [Ichthyophthirius multifiliis]|eukprot:XP_004034894.1 hypothetical protein IMG5_110240 [Ichthyophthirius multifiliis]
MRNLHKLGDVQGLANLLRVDIRTGININNENDIAQRRQLYGSNKIAGTKQIKFNQILKFNIEKNHSLIIFLICFFFLFMEFVQIKYLKNKTEIVSKNLDLNVQIGTLVMLFLSIIINTIKRWKDDRDYNNLVFQNTEYKVKVARNSLVQYIKSSSLVVGDILLIEAGDIINVDGILLKSNDLVVTESPLVSAREGLAKSAHEKGQIYIDCFIYSGSQIMMGQGEMLVCSVGQNTLVNRVQQCSSVTMHKNFLNEKLKDIEGKIKATGTKCLFVFFVFILIKYLFWKGQKFCCLNQQFWFLIQDMLLSAQMLVGVSFYLMQEGISQAFHTYICIAMQFLSQKDIIIKDIQAFQWLGFVDSIVTDKTGCVTKNINFVEKIYANEQEYYNTYSSMNKISIYSNRSLEILCENICINSSDILQTDRNMVDKVGISIESALLEYAFKLGYDYEKYRVSSRIKKVYPFNSKQKRMITVYLKKQGTLRVYFKGSPELILDKCTEFRNKEGINQKLTQAVKQIIREKINQFGAVESLRIILFAFKDIEYDSQHIYSEEKLNQDLIFLALVGIKDPFRPDIPEAIKKCKNAGITVRALTGDNRETAIATGKLIGLLNQNTEYKENNMAILDGEKFQNSISGIGQYTNKFGRGQIMEKIRDIHNFERLIKELRIISRGTSKAKDALVTGLIQLKYIVAVTGDDTADCQIMQKAQVGIGLGLSGNEVVKQAAYIILKNDSFSSIIPSILYARNIYQFLRKYFQLILSQNYVIIFILFITIFFQGQFQPFNCAQFLFMSILLDEFAAFIMAREEPSQQLLKQPPISTKEYIITSDMWRNIFFQSLFQISVISFALFIDINSLFRISNTFTSINQSPQAKFTICFNSLVYFQLFNILYSANVKKYNNDNYGIFWRKFIIFLQISVLLAVYLIIFYNFGKYFGCIQLKLGDHALCLLLGLSNIGLFAFVFQIHSKFFSKFNCLKYTFSLK